MDFPKGIRPHGKRIRIRFNKNGRTYRHSIEVKDPWSKSAFARALRVKKEIESKINLGLPIFESEDGVTVTFSEGAQSYLEQIDVEYSTALSYKKMINRYWIPIFGNRLINEILPADVNREVKKLPVSRKTQRNALCPLRGIFDWAVQSGYALINPCLSIHIRKHVKPPQDPFTQREKDKILGAAAKLYGANHQRLVYYTLLFETGMRPSEALALTWTDYDGKFLSINKTIVCGKHKSSTKNHENRKVYVTQRLRSVLNKHVTRFEAKSVFVHSKGGPYLNNTTLDLHWRKILIEAKIRYRRPYNCRHTYASIGLSAGLEPAFLAGQLGHTIDVFTGPMRRGSMMIGISSNTTNSKR